VFIREIEGDGQRVGGYAGFGQREIIAVFEVWVAIPGVLVNLDAGQVAGALDESGEAGIVESGD
jgi:hypothetical protein